MLCRKSFGEKPVWVCRVQSVLIDKMRDKGNLDKGGGWQCYWKKCGWTKKLLRGKIEFSDDWICGRRVAKNDSYVSELYNWIVAGCHSLKREKLVGNQISERRP